MCNDRPFVSEAEADRRRAPPTKDIVVDVPAAVNKALSGDKWSRMTMTGAKLLSEAETLSADEPFAELLIVVAFMRHYMSHMRR